MDKNKKSKKNIMIFTIMLLGIVLFTTWTTVVSAKNLVNQDKTTQQDISSTYISNLKSTYVYTGKAIKPSVNVISELSEERNNGDGTISVTTYYVFLEKGKDYSVTYKNNTKIGKATVTIKGMGNYMGTQSATYKIVPKSIKIKTLKRDKKQITVCTSKITGGCSYQIAYKKSKSKSWKYTASKNNSKTIKNLKSGKNYLVKVRAYKKVNGQQYNGKWSKVKKIKVK
ncbi:MAG: hypothetical protein Q4D45_02855 [Lachnospiraceae bacterium]|nr:hypothetical protein [Lachnospiraceae bacterium]